MARAGNGNPEGVKTVDSARESILQEGLPIVQLEPMEKPFTEPLKVTRKTFARIAEVHPTPNLIQVQLESYKWFQTVGLRELLDEISPITSFNKQLEVFFLDYWFDEPKHTEKQCRAMDLTYGAPLWVRSRLINKETGEVQEQDVFMGDFPRMTSNGTFIINGAERVVVSQLIRSPGVYFTAEEDRATGRELAGAKLIPSRGAWLEFETSKRDLLSVKVDRKRKLPVTVLLRASGLPSDDELYDTFRDADTDPEHPFIAATIDKDPTKNREDALLEFYKKLRPGDPATLENARSYLNGLLFQERRYDLGRVGRHKLNRRLDLSVDLEARTLTLQDLIAVVRRMILITNGEERPDDIDHLGNRRVKTVGELIQQQLRVGLLRMERVVRERMSIRDPEQLTPISLINIRPVVAATREFFGGSQLSQFMQQTNPLDELTHKRRLSALGPGGLRRERAGFDVRDVHHSHYGRICPIETPEGPNIGLIGSLATFATINEFGFIETPYRRVIRSVANDGKSVVGEVLWEDVTEGDKVVAQASGKVDEATAKKLSKLSLGQIEIVPRATTEIQYLAADDEDKYVIAQANVRLNDEGRFLDRRVSVRHGSRYHLEDVRRVHYVDVSPKQIVSVSASLIPFLEHDDANRALMGSNMQRQAVPLIQPEAPTVATGMEYLAALDSGQVVVSEHDGQVISATSSQIVIRTKDGEDVAYPLRKYQRSNQSTCIDQRPIVRKGERVEKGQVIADSASTDRGELALGQNVVVAFLSWEGGNYEDAVLISDELVEQDKFASIHIEKHEIEARDTKLGPEEITRDIPNVGEEALQDLDESGVIRIGAEVNPGDILVGKITPKGETDLTPEEKLLRAIFGEKAREVKDSSLRLPHGEKGKVVEVREFTREDHQDLAAGVEKMVRVAVAQQRKVTEGDKMAGRHGNKGVISKVVPRADMPFTEDGTPVQMILNPLGVPARMNIGQILETHLGWAAQQLGFKVVSPVFDGAREREIAAELARAWIMDEAWRRLRRTAWNWLVEQGHDLAEVPDNEIARQIYLAQTLAGRDYDAPHIREDVNYARRVAMTEFLVAEGYDPEQILSFGERGRRPQERESLDGEALRACYRLWMQKHGAKVQDGWDVDELEERAKRLSREIMRPRPTSGKMILYDGKTGEPFDQPVTVGIIYMLKLAHLVEDKVHARSTGPYSLVTQQPLGGKAQFGGQRFGEMEVWALEAYGAAHTLQEMLTVKSDDVVGRVKTYEAIVKGEKIREPGVPESFRVLVKELQSLGLSVEVLDDKGQVLHFGREDGDERLPRLALGLGRPRY